MKTGIIIVNYNDSLTTKNFVNSIDKFNSIDKIVVVDNKSNDNSLMDLKKLQSDKIEILQNISNKGYASGVNLGSKYLIELYGECNIIISNPDIVIDKENVIEKLIKLLHSNDDVAVVAPVIKQHNGYDRGWKTPKPWQDVLLNLMYIHRFLKPTLLGYNEKFYTNKTVEVDQVSGCFFLIKSECLKRINYLDEGTFLYYEENILSIKLKKEKLKTLVLTSEEVFHNHSVTIDKSLNKIKKYKILKKSQTYFEKKYNNANLFDLLMLYLTNKLTLVFLYLKALFSK